MRIGFLLLIAALFPLGLPAESAVRQDRRFDQFPTVVARIDGSPVERSAVLSGLRPEELPPAGSSREELAAFHPEFLLEKPQDILKEIVG